MNRFRKSLELNFHCYLAYKRHDELSIRSESLIHQKWYIVIVNKLNEQCVYRIDFIPFIGSDVKEIKHMASYSQFQSQGKPKSYSIRVLHRFKFEKLHLCQVHIWFKK